jgi:hypothetical protein
MAGGESSRTARRAPACAAREQPSAPISQEVWPRRAPLRATASPPLPPVLRVGPAPLLHLQSAARRSGPRSRARSPLTRPRSRCERACARVTRTRLPATITPVEHDGRANAVPVALVGAALRKEGIEAEQRQGHTVPRVPRRRTPQCMRRSAHRARRRRARRCRSCRRHYHRGGSKEATFPRQRETRRRRSARSRQA